MWWVLSDGLRAQGGGMAGGRPDGPGPYPKHPHNTMANTQTASSTSFWGGQRQYQHVGVRTSQGYLLYNYNHNNNSKLTAVRSRRWGFSQWWIRLLLVWMSLTVYSCSAASTSPTEPPERQEKVCKDIDIRNRVNFSKLENCTVIEGSLQILLIDYADPSEYDNLHFPKLLEITDYLLLYRVYGLKTLAHIFPNLAVIRGQKLFFNYALVAFEMPDLEELGLPGLTHIVRGAVRLEKNAKLCYINTIDWSRLARNVSKEDHFISANKDIDQCLDVCPKDEKGSDRCRKLPVPTEDGINRTRAVCWTANHCQKVCPTKCESGCFKSKKTGQAECCNEHCVGGCWGPLATQCFACKHVLGINGRCQPRCIGTYKYMNRRCILKKDCENLKVLGHQYATVQWKLHKDECIKDCPSGFMEEKNKCKMCEGPCPKVCMAKVVDSVATAQELKGCTVIEGILEIQIRGGSQVGRELEANLGLIEKVTEYVKIVRSFAIVSLQFLKNLKIIQGGRKFDDRYSLFVLDNQNLQEIWDLNNHPKLHLLQGDVFFHRNHKLCHFKIVEFVHSIGLDMERQDISTVTNGDQMPCNISQITINVTLVKVSFAVVHWTAFEMNDPRQLLSYVIYYKESPYKNQTIFNAKDSCGSEDWQTYDVRPVEGTDLAELVYDLKPWTQYAMYIQTYTLSSTSEGGVSPIIYFTTLPTTPTHPRDVKVIAISPNELKVTWLPPNKPNGNVTHYQVYWQPQPLNREKLDKRNYCSDKLHLAWKTKQSKVEQERAMQRNRTLPSHCCKCPKTEEEMKQAEEERRMEIEFQNFLQDTVYVKRPPKNGRPENKADGPDSAGSLAPRNGRRRRRELGHNVKKIMQMMNDTDTYWPEGLNISSLSNMSMVNESDGHDEEHVPYVAAVVYGKTEMILPNLRHFQEYSIEVIACHDPLAHDKMKQCSNRAITTGRTLPLRTADNINLLNVTSQVEPGGRVRLKWNDPPEPNGLIVTYEIEYGKVSHENYKMDVLCIPHMEYRQINGYIMGDKKRLQPGNYSYRIRATSLAGNGTWTPKGFFFLEERYDEASFRNMLVIVIPVVVVLLFLIVVFASMFFFYKKRMVQNLPEGVLYASVNMNYGNLMPGEVYVPDKWEVPRDKIRLIRELGQGSFGMVHEGIAKDLMESEPTVRVAVKTVNENATIRDRIEFLQEASVMKAFNCNHVVKLLGVVSKTQPTMVIMELMAAGDLKNFLRVHRPNEQDNNGRKPPTLKQVLQMASEIADGMAYLAAMKFVHRDLAARNCMVSEDHVCKVGDFGMTRDIYETDYYRKGGKGLLPVRWMAPESLKDGIFTSQSDVWSFGVVLWEMATLAFQPYQGLANEEVLEYVISGKVMRQPYNCPERLYNFMLLCWRHEAKQRPTFIQILASLEADINETFRQKSYFYSEERKEKEREQTAMQAAQANAITPEEFEPSNEDEDITTPLTGSPRYGSLDHIDDVLPMPRASESICPQCSRRRPCECIDIESSTKVKPGPSSGSPQRRLYQWGGRSSPLPTANLPSSSGDHRYHPPALGTVEGGGAVGGSGSSNSNRAGRGAGEPSVTPPPPYSSSQNSEAGSKESSKSSGSSHVHLNGMSNGHLPRAYLAQQNYAEC